MLGHRHMPAGPEPFLTAVAPYREDLVVCGACIFPWYGLADLWAREAMPVVLGHALSMPALPGGKATTDTSDSQKRAVRRRGGLLPPAYGDPAAMRAPRAWLRRRRPLRRQRAARLAPGPKTTSQDNLPSLGQTIASQAKRDGSAERWPAPAVPQSLAVALALSGHDAHRLNDVACSLVHPATQPAPQTVARLQAVPGRGPILRLGRLDAIPPLDRFPRVQDGGSSCRRGQCAKASAGKRDGTAGAKLGKASRQGACSEAARLGLRPNPAGHKALARFEHTHGQGTAWTVLAPQRARAVSARFKRQTAGEMPRLLQSAYGAERGSPTSHWPLSG